jgi:aryl-alcohol dehydrogenase-like predicted oxidoreductase
MQYTTLGRTGLRVSVAGLGCGSNSRLGLGAGKSEDEATALVRQKEKGKIGHLGITETPPRDPDQAMRFKSAWVSDSRGRRIERHRCRALETCALPESGFDARSATTLRPWDNRIDTTKPSRWLTSP